MMKLLSLSPDPHKYASLVRFESHTLPGVYVTLRRMSLGRRIDLARMVRDLVAQLEFHQAGSSALDKLSAAEAAASIGAVYLRWAVSEIENLEIDGIPAGADRLTECGPEELVREIVNRIRRECGLSADERKN